MGGELWIVFVGGVWFGVALAVLVVGIVVLVDWALLRRR